MRQFVRDCTRAARFHRTHRMRRVPTAGLTPASRRGAPAGFGDWILIDRGEIGDGYSRSERRGGRWGNQVRAAPPLRCMRHQGVGGLLVEKAETATRCGFTVLVLEGRSRGSAAGSVGRPVLEARSARSGVLRRRAEGPRPGRSSIGPVLGASVRLYRFSDPFGGSMGIGGPAVEGLTPVAKSTFRPPARPATEARRTS